MAQTTAEMTASLLGSQVPATVKQTCCLKPWTQMTSHNAPAWQRPLSNSQLSDIIIRCAEPGCDEPFVFTAEQQLKHQELGFENKPRRCSAHRKNQGCAITLLVQETALMGLNAYSNMQKTLTLQLILLWVLMLVSSNLGLSTVSAIISIREFAFKEETVPCNMSCLMIIQKKALLGSKREFISDFVSNSVLDLAYKMDL